MTDEEKNKMMDDFIKKIKSIPQLGVLYDTMSTTMPGLMETVIEQGLTEFIFDRKINNDEIINRCEHLLLEFYDYYNIVWERFVDKNGNHIYDEIITTTFPNAKVEYQTIWKVIISAQNNEIKKLEKSSFAQLNELHKKYKKGK